MDKDFLEDIQENKILLYTTNEGKVNVDVYFYDENFWLSQKAMAQLFNVEVNTINYHLKEIYDSEELIESSTIRKSRIVQNEGSREVLREITFYNLDAIIAVGYRVNSKQATQFRKWATQTLKEYIIKGFVLNDEILKNGAKFGKDYFDELLEKIKEIRASERRFYQKITDIYASCSYDYNKDTDITDAFFKTVQNKLIFAIAKQTAPEIIAVRADFKKENMGLTSWKNSPKGEILKSDVTISKNYLMQDELKGLNNIVNMYLDYAETQAKRHKLLSMQDWVDKLDAFIKFNEYDILNNSGKVAREVADALALKEYEKYRVLQDKKYISDFDEAAQKYLKEDN